MKMRNNLIWFKKQQTVLRFFEVLISYVIIPLIAVFTIILLIYIVQNIGGEFWTDNLLEPMIVSYSITIIVVYLLASEIENKFTVLFRRILPKILIPIVIFQVISSLLSLSKTGDYSHSLLCHPVWNICVGGQWVFKLLTCSEKWNCRSLLDWFFYILDSTTSRCFYNK